MEKARLLRLLLMSATLLGLPGSIQAQTDEESLPILGPGDLNLDASHLVPHRMTIDAGAGVFGNIFQNPQLMIQLERTVYYDEAEDARDALRIRWIANTHPHTDLFIVDAHSLAIRDAAANRGRMTVTRTEVTHFRSGGVRRTIISTDQDPQQTVTDLEHPDHYAIAVMPYLIASMNIEGPVSFRLPTFGSTGKEGTFRVDVVGDTQYANLRGEEVTAYLVRTYHGGVNIDWFVDRDSAPYLIRSVWHYQAGDVAGQSSVYEPVGFEVFEDDIFMDVIVPTIENEE